MSKTILNSEPLKVKYCSQFLLQKQGCCHLRLYILVISHFTLRLHKRALFEGAEGNNFELLLFINPSLGHGVYNLILVFSRKDKNDYLASNYALVRVLFPFSSVCVTPFVLHN